MGGTAGISHILRSASQAAMRGESNALFKKTSFIEEPSEEPFEEPFEEPSEEPKASEEKSAKPAKLKRYQTMPMLISPAELAKVKLDTHEPATEELNDVSGRPPCTDDT